MWDTSMPLVRVSVHRFTMLDALYRWYPAIKHNNYYVHRISICSYVYWSGLQEGFDWRVTRCFNLPHFWQTEITCDLSQIKLLVSHTLLCLVNIHKTDWDVTTPTYRMYTCMHRRMHGRTCAHTCHACVNDEKWKLAGSMHTNTSCLDCSIYKCIHPYTELGCITNLYHTLSYPTSTHHC